MNLNELGWNSDFQQQYEPYESKGFSVGRIAAEYRHYFKVMTLGCELLGEVSGKMRFSAAGRGDLPAVGDWVVLKENDGKAIIHAVLPRKSKFSRNVAGTVTEEQIVAANIDTVLLVNALNQDFNLRRLERYLLLAWDSGAAPVIVLSKADLCEEIERKIDEVRSVAFGVPVHAVSTINGEGLGSLDGYIEKGKTIALLGSSGVGKSTLLNALAGEELQRVNEIREEDGRGKHTTTHRELIVLPNGGIIIDTPGMRELQLQASDEGLSSAFEDIEELANQCFFRDCKHQQEPGCAIRAAIDAGELDAKRYRNYLKMERELAHIAQKEKEKDRKNERANSRLKKKDRL